MTPDSARLRHLSDAVCLACGCLCDDIALSVDGERVVEAELACPIGRAWFVADHSEGERLEATIEGQPANPEHALDRAVKILREARAPIVTGLSGATVEAQRLAVAVADQLGAVLDPVHSAKSAPGLDAFQRIGRVGATLGEVRNRADVVVFWGVDPLTTHPRHLERYSVDPVGRFVPDGRAGRTILVANHSPTPTATGADDFLKVSDDRQFEVLWALRALVRDISINPDATIATTGIPLDRLRAWADRLSHARYGAWFYELGPGGSPVAAAVLQLVRDLNSVTRFVALPLGGPGNPSGADAVTAWQTGCVQNIDFAGGYPRFLPGEASAEVHLARGATDAALLVGSVDFDVFSPGARAHLRRIPTVVISPEATRGDAHATVALSSATPGIHTGGTVVRADGAWLPLRPTLESKFPADSEWLELLLRHLAPTDNEGS